jgi:RluA family pseudouridine synthase
MISQPDVPVLWVDEAILVVNKPARLPTLPDGYNAAAPYLVGVLQRDFGRLWVVHRLDRDTSGVLLLARTREAHRALNIQFEQRQTSKVYHALVAGTPEWSEETVSLPLRADGDRKHRTVVDVERGKPSVTRFRVLERLAAFTLVEAMPETGRTHQIRAHLAAAGLPVAADALYGDGAPVFSLERLGLHAWSLAITHPLTEERQQYTAPYPEDIVAALCHLRGAIM